MAKNKLSRVFKQHLDIESQSSEVCEHEWKACKQKVLEGYLRCGKCGGWSAYAVLPPMDLFYDKSVSLEIHRRVQVQLEVYNRTIIYLCELWDEGYAAAVEEANENNYQVPSLGKVKKHMPSRADMFRQAKIWNDETKYLDKNYQDCVRSAVDAAHKAFFLRADKYLSGKRNIQKVKEKNNKTREANANLPEDEKKSMKHPSKTDQKWLSIDMSNPERLLKDAEDEEHKKRI